MGMALLLLAPEKAPPSFTGQMTKVASAVGFQAASLLTTVWEPTAFSSMHAVPPSSRDQLLWVAWAEALASRMRAATAGDRALCRFMAFLSREFSWRRTRLRRR